MLRFHSCLSVVFFILCQCLYVSESSSNFLYIILYAITSHQLHPNTNHTIHFYSEPVLLVQVITRESESYRSTDPQTGEMFLHIKYFGCQGWQSQNQEKHKSTICKIKPLFYQKAKAWVNNDECLLYVHSRWVKYSPI